MSHHSIAIIRRKYSSESADHPHYHYLVLSDNHNQYFFFETVNKSIGATFDFSSFNRAIYRHFGLDYNSEYNSNDQLNFETPPQPFKHSIRNPFATSYIYQLSDRQVEILNERIHSTSHPHLKNVKWLTESELKSQAWKDHQKFLFVTEEPFKQPEFTNDFRADLTKIVEAKNNGKLVIFVGAGVSYDSNVPGWGELIEALKADLTTSETDFLKVAQEYYDVRGHKEYYDKVLKVLAYGKTICNAVHKKITDISPIHIVTTNYDNHFEQVIEQRSLGYSTIRTDSDLPFAKGNSLYVKMHGDLGIKKIVLKKRDYDNYSKDFPLIESFIKETFASKLVLFLGFSFDDSNLQKILKTVQRILKSDIQRPYLFAGSISSEAKKEKWSSVERKGIKVISFNSALSEYFNQICFADDIENLAKIKKQSQEVYTFLRVVEDFDPSSDGIDNLEIQKQLTHSLSRFDGLNAIPIQILKRIAPFKLKKQPKYDSSSYADYSPYQPFHLQTSNEELLEFLKSKKGLKDNIDYSITSDPNFSPDEQNLNRAFKTLDNSGIDCIIRKNDTSTEHFKLNGINAKSKCNCLRCLAKGLAFKELIQTLSNSEVKAICEGDRTNEKLLEAYAYYKTGQPVKCYYALEGAKNTALKEQNYITYFLASYNQTKILLLVKNCHESEIKAEQIDSIVQKISQIDLYELLNKIPVENMVRQCLRYVLENRIRYDVSSDIQDEFEQIIENYNKHKKAGYHVHGPTTWYNFQARFYIIWNFYHQNLLFTQGDHDFTVLVKLYIEAMIASYATSKRYAQRMEEIPQFFNEISIHFGSANHLTSIFKKYKIDYLEQLDKDNSLLNNFHTFLESAYDKNNFLGENIAKNPLFDSLVNTSYLFEGTVTQLFNNQLVLLQHCNLTAEEVNVTIDKIINFLSVTSNFGYSNSFKYFLAFVSRKISQIDEVRINKIFQFSLSDNIWPSGIVSSLSSSLIQSGKIISLTEDFLALVIKRIDSRREWPMKVRDAIPMFQFLKPKQQTEFSEFLIKVFPQKIPRDIIQYGHDWGMWNPIDNKSLFEEIFGSVVKGFGNFPKYTITKNGQPLGNDFTSWNEFYFVLRLLYRYNLLDSEIASQLYKKTNHDLFKWILSPANFDYSKFELKWALTFTNKDILKTTKKCSELTTAISELLKTEFNSKIARIYLTKD